MFLLNSISPADKATGTTYVLKYYVSSISNRLSCQICRRKIKKKIEKSVLKVFQHYFGTGPHLEFLINIPDMSPDGFDADK